MMLGLIPLFLATACTPDGGARKVASDAPASAPDTPLLSAPQTGMASHFFFRPAGKGTGAWVALLPGASGLKIFEDGEHYFRAADALNAEGFDALVVDYKAAYKAASHPALEETGDKIAWVTEQAIGWARANGKITHDRPGAIVAWSLGAEGLWPLLADDARVRTLGIKAAAAYYPSNQDHAKLRTGVPLLILTGEKDDVVELKAVHAMTENAASPLVTLRTYPNARHGFDVSSIPTPRTISLIPLIGPTATFGFDPEASHAASAELRTFLRSHLGAGS